MKLAKTWPTKFQRLGTFSLQLAQTEFSWPQEIQRDEVFQLVQKLDPGKASGILMLGTRILKACLIHIVPFFTRFLNYCIKRGKFPEAWKRAVVVPIPKGAKNPTLSNIRPISLLPCPGKIFEEIIHKRLYRYLELNTLLCPEQSGFRKNFSVSDPVLDLTNEVSRAFNEGHVLICIYIDMAKAFNSLNGDLLIEKISKLGFKDNILNLLRDYLTNREQITSLGGEMSGIGKVAYGVPQGSILGPNLFNIYMNNLPSIFSTVVCRMYADDTILFKSVDLSKDLDHQLSLINKDLSLLGNWCTVNKLTINVDKSKAMLFVAPLSKNRNLDHNDLPALSLNGSRLTFVNSYKYLGIELDRHLKMDLQLNSMMQKVRPIGYKFSKIRYLIAQKTALLMYKTYVLPMLEFGLFILDNYYKGQVEKLQKVQNRCLRMCFRKDRQSSARLLHLRAKLLPLRHRRECCLLNLLNEKLIKGDGVFNVDVGKSNRARGGTQVTVPFPKTETFKKSLAYLMPSLWNALPAKCKENCLPWVFKRNVKRLHIEKFKEEDSV